jgi:hypothetical protein
VASAVGLRGYRELQAAFARADRESRLFVRGEFRQIAEPIRRDAETLAAAKIRRMERSPQWAKMRIGITRNLVYIAPRQRGVRSRGADPRRRPNLAPLLMERAMEPALERHAAGIERTLDRALDRIADHFDR